MSSSSPKFTIHYEREGEPKIAVVRTKRSVGEVIHAFHQRMQNVKGIEPEKYHVRKVVYGEEFHKDATCCGTKTYESPAISKTYRVTGKTSMKFE